MVQELRQISLKKEELIAALESHGHMMPGFLPAGRIVDYKTANNDSVILALDGPDGKRGSVTLDRVKLVQPLIRFCIENNIMLPRGGRKTILIGNDVVSLSIQLDIEIALDDATEPMRLPVGASAAATASAVR